MKTVCELDKCCGCMACVDSCGKNAVSIKDTLTAYNAVIDESLCVSCGACEKVCPNINPVAKTEPLGMYQGWSGNEGVRAMASSGGIATELALTFVKNGGQVAACTFSEGKFGFKLFECEHDIEKIAGSKYVKSNPIGIYKLVKRQLQTHDVLFIGLPCQVAAVKAYVGAEAGARLTTVDLICHGTPSPQLLDAFLTQSGTSCEQLKSISFREKTKFGLSAVPPCNQKYKNAVDTYMRAFLSSVSYTENCYSCRYACLQRVSDITLGDSWGTELPEDERKKGISLILYQTEKGHALLQSAHIELKPVDEAKAVARNHQLVHPSVAPKGRKRFFKSILKGHSFDFAVLRALPKDVISQRVRSLLKK